jgi:hypothetical protein
MYVFNNYPVDLTGYSKLILPSNFGIKLSLAQQFNLLAIYFESQINIHFYDNLQIISFFKRGKRVYFIKEVIFLKKNLILAICRTMLSIIQFDVDISVLKFSIPVYWP